MHLAKSHASFLYEVKRAPITASVVRSDCSISLFYRKGISLVKLCTNIVCR